MSTQKPPPAWQTSLEPALVRRLHREPGIVSPAITRRIVGWVDFFARRTGAFVDLLRLRGRVGALRASEVPIVHARWAEAPGPTWPVEAQSPVTVSIVRASLPAEVEVPDARPAPAPTVIMKTPAVEAPRLPLPAALAPPAAPRREAVDIGPEIPPVRAERRKNAGLADAEDAVIIHLPPARRVVRGPQRALQAPADVDAPPARPPRDVAPVASPTPRPRVEPARAPASLPMSSPVPSPLPGTVSPSVSPSPVKRPLIVPRRPRSSTIVSGYDGGKPPMPPGPAGDTPPLPVVTGKRPDAAAPVHRVEAQPARPSAPRAAATARVTPAEAAPPARAPLVHTGPIAPSEPPRGQAPSTDHRPSPVMQAPPVTTQPPARSAPAPAPEPARPLRSARRDLDIDTLVDTVERRIRKNFAVERERKGGRG